MTTTSLLTLTLAGTLLVLTTQAQQAPPAIRILPAPAQVDPPPDFDEPEMPDGGFIIPGFPGEMMMPPMPGRYTLLSANIQKDGKLTPIVLRIDSPGGSALACDRMWHAVRRLAGRTFVVASLGDVAASGGYYIAAAAREIYAQPASIVGSIGVLGGKVDASGLFERLGVSPVVITRGARAAWMTPTRGLTEDEHAAVAGLLRSAYERFLRRVGTGREMPRAEVHAVAQGRVMSGLAGHRLGLVDTLGGFSAAVARARELGELPADAPLEEWPRDASVLEALTSLATGARTQEAVTFSLWMELAERISPRVADMSSAPLLLCEDPILAALPYSVEIR